MNDTNLPQEIIQRITHPLARFFKIQAATGITLLLATTVAIALSNSVWSEAYQSFWETETGLHFGPMNITRSLRHWINDGLMTLFFFVTALELKRELVLGELHNLRMAMLPLSGAIGGMLFPALLYLTIMHDRPEAHGWGIVMATDTAFVIGCLALLGSRVPSNLRLFFLSLAIFDDIGAILVVAFGYGDSLNWTAVSFGLIGFLTILVAAKLGIRNIAIYSLLGIIIWLCFDTSGIHPTIAGVILGLMTPAHSWISDRRLRSILDKVLAYPTGDHWSGDTKDRDDLRQASTAARETLSPVERLEIRLHPWVGFVIMPVFTLANAGVKISFQAFLKPTPLAIFLGLVCGKPIGVFVMSWLSVRLGFATLFSNINWQLIAAGSLLTGIGFTMSLFIAGLAFDQASLDAAKIGILAASVIAAAAGLLTLLLLTSTKGITKTEPKKRGRSI